MDSVSHQIAKKVNTKVVVYFKDYTRSPVFGTFIDLKDSEELAKKGMVRFVSESRWDLFDLTKDEKHTQIMTISSLKYIV